jgi:hypothetical protein
MGCDEPVGALVPIPLAMPTRTGGTITYATTTDSLYTLQSCEDLVSGDWQDVPGCTRIQGSGGLDSLSDPEPGAARFYRVVVEQP